MACLADNWANTHNIDNQESFWDTVFKDEKVTDST